MTSIIEWFLGARRDRAAAADIAEQRRRDTETQLRNAAWLESDIAAIDDERRELPPDCHARMVLTLEAWETAARRDAAVARAGGDTMAAADHDALAQRLGALRHALAAEASHVAA